MNTLTMVACYALGVGSLWVSCTITGFRFDPMWVLPMWVALICGHVAGYTNRGRDDTAKAKEVR